MKSLTTWVGASLLLLATHAAALEVAGVKVDDAATVAGQTLQLNGAGLRTKIVFKVYVAALYATTKSANAESLIRAKTPRRVQLTMLRDLSSEKIIEAFKEGIDNNASSAELAQQKTTLEEFYNQIRQLKEVKAGQTVSLDFSGSGVTMSVNGEKRGSLAGEAIESLILKIWLGDKPIEDGLKKALLGGK